MSSDQDTSDNNYNDSDDNLLDVVDALDEVDEDSPSARANAQSISDNNGGRIELDNNHSSNSVVEGIFTDNREFEKIDPDSLDKD